MLEVYWGSGSPYAWRVLLCLEIKRISYESRRLSFTDKELESSMFLAISPRGKVPAIRDETFTLSESIAIMQYLDEKYPDHLLFGNSIKERSKIWRSIMETISYIEPAVAGFIDPVFSDQISENKTEVINAQLQIEQELDRINNELNNNQYLINNTLSAADIALYPFIKFLDRIVARESTHAVRGELHNLHERYLSINNWCRAIESIPGYEKTYPPHWKTVTQ